MPPTPLYRTNLLAARRTNLRTHPPPAPAAGYLALPAAILFSLSNNTLFSLLHESVHGIFSANPTLNQWAGRYTALWFPTGYTLQKTFHLVHHQNNRSPSEQFDILHPQDIRWLKYAQWYAIYTGIYWLTATIGAIAFSLTPRFIPNTIRQLFGKQGGEQTGAENYISALNRLPLAAKAEVWSAIAFQAALFALLDLTWQSWLLCYAAFGWQWSNLQYTDHAFSPLDTKNGAWNLIVPKPIRLFFLNYHYHLAHHQHPQTPWTQLPQHAHHGAHFWTIWRHCITGPKPQDKLPHIPTYPIPSRQINRQPENKHS